MTNFTLSDKIRELAAGYVLDELDFEELETFEQMMLVDAAVRQEVRELQIALGGLSLDVPPMEPPAHLRAKTLAALGVIDEQVDELVELVAPRKKTDWSKIMAIFALGTVVALLWDNFRLRQDLSFAQQQTTERVASLLQRSSSKLVSLTSQTNDSVGGTLVFTPGKWQEVLLSVQNLPPLPVDQVYRLWLNLNSQQTIYCGEFQTDQNGRISRSIQPPQVPPAGTKATGMFITVEKKNGSIAPTGARVISGTI